MDAVVDWNSTFGSWTATELGGMMRLIAGIFMTRRDDTGIDLIVILSSDEEAINFSTTIANTAMNAGLNYQNAMDYAKINLNEYRIIIDSIVRGSPDIVMADAAYGRFNEIEDYVMSDLNDMYDVNESP